MGLRYRKRIKVAPGLHLNISKSGISTSVGKPGSTLNISKRGARATVGLPGTGLSYSQNLGRARRKRQSSSKNRTEALASLRKNFDLTQDEAIWLANKIQKHPRRFTGDGGDNYARYLIKRHRSYSFKNVILGIIKFLLVLIITMLIFGFISDLTKSGG